MTIFLHCLFCAAVEMTGEWKRQSDMETDRRQTLRSLPAGAVILNAVLASPFRWQGNWIRRESVDD